MITPEDVCSELHAAYFAAWFAAFCAEPDDVDARDALAAHCGLG